MAGTIYSGTHLNGIVLGNPTTQLPATVTGTVSNTDGDAIYGKPVARWTVANSGTIQTTGSTGYGIDLGARGTVKNGVSGTTAGLIAGYGGVLIRGELARVGNLGTIKGTGSKRDGVELKRGGRVSNGSAGATAAQISDGRHAVVIRNAAGTVRNFGTLTSTGSYNTVDLFAGGSVSNGSNASTKALISGSASAVDVNGTTGTVTNFGTIDAGWGVVLRAGGRITNGSAAATGALINGTHKGVDISGAAGTVTNFATISGGSEAVYAVDLRDGGKVTNGSATSTSALIRGSPNGDRVPGGGVNVTGAAGTITNFATISADSEAGDAVDLRDGGRVMNGIGGRIGKGIDGVDIVGAAAVTNFGTIEGAAWGVADSSGPGTVTNLGTIEGGISLQSGVVTNGSNASTTAFIRGNIWFGGYDTLKNFGTILGLVGNGPGVVTIVNFGKIASTIGVSGEAIALNSEDGNKLVVEPGSIFVGKVIGGGSVSGVERGSTIDFETAGVADMSNVSDFKAITLGNGKSHSLTLTDANFYAGFGASVPVVTVDDGDSGNTVTAETLPGRDSIIVRAGAGLDKLTAGAGDDVLFAGGDTAMTGGAGRNEFVFSAPGGNTVGDFAVSAPNEIVFSDKGFKLGLSGAGATPKALPAGLFVENSDGHFTSASQNFAYATGTGDLFYSASGNSGTPALVSHFTHAPSLAAAQLFFIT